MLTEAELRAMVAIDPSNLEEECARQPELFMEVCDCQAELKAEAKVAKHNLDQVKAKVMLGYRSGEISTSIKITETSIASLADAHADVIAAKSALVAAEKLSWRCDGLVSAYDHRRSMLSNEVSLYESQYYQNAGIRCSGVQDKRADKVGIEKEIIARRAATAAEKVK